MQPCGRCTRPFRRTGWAPVGRGLGAKGAVVGARLDAGAIVDEVVAEDGSVVQVRYERCPAGWQASFELRHPDVGDLAVVHRLVNDTLAEAKATVPNAIAFLKGRPVDDDL
jgi:hypothetical protein